MKQAPEHRLVAERTKAEWEKELAKAEKRRYQHKEAQQLYAEKQLKDKEIFQIVNATMQRPGSNEEIPAYVIATFLYGKLIFAKLPMSDQRRPRLRRHFIATLMDICRTNMVNTRKEPYLPPRWQSLKDPSIVIFGKTSTDTNYEESGTLSEDMQIYDASEAWHISEAIAA